VDFGAYVSWLHTSTRVHLRTRWTEDDILEEPDDVVWEFDDAVRLGKRVDRGPVRDRVVTKLTHLVSSYVSLLVATCINVNGDTL
jgi:hypothetical protein